ncbi:MAG: lytic transglycosylase domain-containing protein [Rickettsiales bacterium]|jgi:soluble lytic murein transglycosylase|nr:lytic transglycosylase domain-containing protein [Rickettsiales bacterium]
MLKLFFIFSLFCGIVNATNVENLFYNTNKDIKLKMEFTEKDEKIFKNTLKMIEKKDFPKALSLANSMESEYLRDGMIIYVLWQKYKMIDNEDIDNNFADLMAFIERYKYLPDIENLKRNLENMYLKSDISNEYVENYFKNNKPIKIETAIKLLKNGILTNHIKVFNDYELYGENLVYFINLFKDKLNTNGYVNKIESLILNKKFIDARYIMKFLNKNDASLYETIIQINTTPKNFNELLKGISYFSKSNELLLYTKFMYYQKKGDNEEAKKLIMEVPRDSKFIDKWWYYQKYYVREYLKDKDYVKSYFLATNQNLKRGTIDYAEAEWLAGWVALDFLNEKGLAYKHFKNLFDNVSYPASKARAAYWLGRVDEDMANIKNALRWYEIGTQFSLYYYGQLSWYAKNRITQTASLTNEMPLPKQPTFTQNEENDAINNEIAGLAYLVAKTGGERKIYIELFRSAIISAKSTGEKVAIFEIVKNIKDEVLITNIAKFLAYRQIYFIDNLFPTLTMINLKNSNSHLIHAIIKQESGFHVLASSRVGASGFMQIMPATAKILAKQLKLKYNKKQLQTNPIYNILLGSQYINSLISQFDGSEVLAIASYNAGPGAVKRWISRYGDPRKMTEIRDIVRWIESIEYNETRDYVQKVVENGVVYQYIIGSWDGVGGGYHVK